MLKNVNYNLLEEITELSKGLYRYDTYAEDARAAECEECAALWSAMRERQEQDLTRLLQHLKLHIDKDLIEFKNT